MSFYATALLNWYDIHQRCFPWRKNSEFTPKPWQIWISEIMLQQTTVQTVLPRYLEFMELWPTFAALSKASEDDLLTFWQGLGYYSRARNLHKGIQYVQENHKGILPQSFMELKKIPGLGDYAAAAVAAIAFDEKVLAVDVNVSRLFARFYCLEQQGDALRKQIQSLVTPHIPDRAGDFSQACIELGGTICRASNPKCAHCPLQQDCAAYNSQTIELYPKKIAKKPKQQRQAYFYRIYNHKGQILLLKRPDKGLLASMYVLPSNNWYEDHMWDLTKEFEDMVKNADFLYEFSHIFTHIHLTADVFELHLSEILPIKEQHIWANINQLQDLALPTMIKKALKG